ncbi:hypothetical protein FRC03_003718 [Tulasnella sp. 419]|nr:hypothetical protein FRC03_003718 [Tulasnella sp. 419]
MAFSLHSLRPKAYVARYPKWLVGRKLLYASSALASLGDAMFGYSQGVMASVQVQPSFLRRMYGVNVTMDQIASGQTGVDPFVQAITVACLNITAFIASIYAAGVCDVLGRRMSVRIGAFVYLVAAIIQIFAPNLAALIVGRCIQGIGVGFLSMTVPIIQSEIAPGHSRGLFVSIEYLCLNSGYALSAWVGYGFFHVMPSEISWRGPYILQSVLAVILFLWTFLLPETPRFLVKAGFYEEALQTLADLHSNGNIDNPEILKTFQEIVEAVELEKKIGGDATWKELFTKYTRQTIMGITSQMFSQLNGINAILYFLPTNLSRGGFDIPKSLLYSGICAIVYVLGTIPTMFLVDTWGRKPILLFGSVGTCICLSIVGGLQFYADSIPSTAEFMFKRLQAANGIFAFVCIYLFVFGFSWGPVPWLLPAEVFAMRARAKGMALATGSNWAWNFIIAFITPPLFDSIKGGYYFILAGLVIISFFLVLIVYRETAFKTLEELAEVFGEPAFAPVLMSVSKTGEVSVMGRRTSDHSSSGSDSGGSINEMKEKTRSHGGRDEPERTVGLGIILEDDSEESLDRAQNGERKSVEISLA